VDRSTQWAVVLTAVGVIALALAAATLPSTVSTPETGSGSGNGTGSGLLPTEDPPQLQEFGFDLPAWVATGFFVVSVVFVAAYLVIDPREALKSALAVAAVVVVLMAFLLVLGEILGALTGGDGSGSGLFGDPGAPDRTGQVDPSALDPSVLVVAAIVGAILLTAVVALYRATGDATADEEEEPAVASDDGGAAVADVGRAAGRAADRIEAAADADNEVYRAWREMADLLDLQRPETATPGEFAEAAVAAGMDPDDVSELTRLFEEVRYGEAPATEEREQVALRTMRRIEDAYADPSEEEWPPA